MNSYLIPANSKKSMLILGLFTVTDLIIFISGVAATFLLWIILPTDKFIVAILSSAPLAICTFLVLPVPNYHNIRTAIRIAWEFYTTRQKFIWKGWCFSDGEETEKK